MSGRHFIILWLVLVAALLSLPHVALPQNGGLPDSKTLTQDAFRLFQQNRFEEAVDIAAKVVDLERKATPSNPKNLAMALLNLANLQKEHYWVLRKDLSNPAVLTDVLRQSAEKRRSYATSIPNFYREVIAIYKTISEEDAFLASARFELASFLSKTGNGTSTADDPLSDLDANFSSAIALYSKFLGSEDDQTNFAVLTYADYLKSRANVELAEPLFDRYVRFVQAKYGRRSDYLLPAMRSLCLLRATVMDTDSVNEIVRQIAAVTGKTEPACSAELDLTPRTKKDYAGQLMSDPKTITTTMKKLKFLLVAVTIDERGSVTEAVPGDTGEKDMFGKDVKNKAAKEVANWKFQPYLKDGNKHPMKGIVWYPYLVKA